MGPASLTVQHMFRLPGYTIGDSWFVVGDGVAHGFFCTSPEPRPSWNWDIGHAVSRDLVHWDFLGFALERGAGEAWDSQTLSTGSVLAWKGRFWMAYSALRRNENPPTRKVHRVGLAVSDDLYSWTKCESNPVNERDPGLYERLGPVRKAFGQWRDPFLFEVEGRLHQLVCARSKHPDRSRRGAVGLASSRDMQAWRVEPPLDIDPIATEIEVPQVYRIDGRCYLLFWHLGRPHRPVVQAPVSRASLSECRLLDGRRVAAGTVSDPWHRRGAAAGRAGAALRQPPHPVAGAMGHARHGHRRRHAVHLRPDPGGCHPNRHPGRLSGGALGP